MSILERTAALLIESRGDLSARVFSRWDQRLFTIYRTCEERCFVPELLYTEEELLERSVREDFGCLLVSGGDQTAAVLMAYRDEDPEIFYLDTLAVVKPGEKLGVLLVRSLIQAAGEHGLKGIGLDTERINGRGQKLVDFYSRLGFTVTEENESGNIRMDLRFPPSRH